MAAGSCSAACGAALARGQSAARRGAFSSSTHPRSYLDTPFSPVPFPSPLSLSLSTQIYETSPERVKNFGIWFRYDSRTGTHNAYKEYRECKLTDAINAVYQDMAGRSRAKSAAIQILKTAELKPEECKRPIITQFHTSKIKFPLPHRVAKTPKEFKTTFKASAPTTFC